MSLEVSAAFFRNRDDRIYVPESVRAQIDMARRALSTEQSMPSELSATIVSVFLGYTFLPGEVSLTAAAIYTLGYYFFNKPPFGQEIHRDLLFTAKMITTATILHYSIKSFREAISLLKTI